MAGELTEKTKITLSGLALIVSVGCNIATALQVSHSVSRADADQTYVRKDVLDEKLSALSSAIHNTTTQTDALERTISELRIELRDRDAAHASK